MNFEFGGKKYFIKQSWNALDLREMLLCYAIITTRDIEDFFTKKLLLIEALSGVSVDDWATLEMEQIAGFGIEEGQKLHAECLSAALACVEFLFEKTGENTYAISPTLTKCPYPKLYAQNHKTLYAPADALDNISFYEMTQIFDLQNQIIAGDLIAIDELLALVYRPSKAVTGKAKKMNFEGDRREPLLNNEDTIRARRMKLMQIETTPKMLIHFWLSCCMHTIMTTYSGIFAAATENKKATNDYGWAGIMLKLSGGVVDLDAVANTHFSNVLLQLQIWEDERREADNKE